MYLLLASTGATIVKTIIIIGIIISVVIYFVLKWKKKKKAAQAEADLEQAAQILTLESLPDTFNEKDEVASLLCDDAAQLFAEGKIEESTERYKQAYERGSLRGQFYYALNTWKEGGFEILFDALSQDNARLYPSAYSLCAYILTDENSVTANGNNRAARVLQEGIRMNDPRCFYQAALIYDGDETALFQSDIMQPSDKKAIEMFERCASFYPLYFNVPESAFLIEAARLKAKDNVKTALVSCLAYHYTNPDDISRKKVLKYAEILISIGASLGHIVLAQCYSQGNIVSLRLTQAEKHLRAALDCEDIYINKDFFTEVYEDYLDTVDRYKSASDSSKSVKGFILDIDQMNSYLDESKRKREEEEAKEKFGQVEKDMFDNYHFYEEGGGYSVKLRKFDEETGVGETEDGRKVKNKYL